MQSQVQNLAKYPSQSHPNQSFYNQNVSLPQPTYSYPVPPIQIQQNRMPLASSYTPRPVSSIDVAPIKQSFPLSQSQIVSLPHQTKHPNKYSFKRNTTNRSKAVSNINRNSVEVIAVITKQEDIFSRIRNLAVTRRGTIENASKSAEGVTLWNTLTQIHNLTLAGQTPQLQPLQFIPEFNSNQNQVPRYPPQTNFTKVGVRPIEFFQSNQPVKFVKRAQNEKVMARPASSRVQEVKGQFVPGDLPILSAHNSNIQLYTLQIRELRAKIQTLEQEKSTLHEHVHTLEQNANFGHSQETIQHYRSEIGSLREQISRLSQSYQPVSQQNEINELRQRVQQLSEQLLQAHNYITFLQNSRNEETSAMQAEVLALKKAILEHATIEQQLDIERAKSLQYQQQLKKAREQLIIFQRSSRLKTAKFDESNLNNKDYSSDYQVTRLSFELSQAQQKYKKCHQHLAKAEDYIIQLQESRQILHAQFDAELKKLQEENGRLLVQLHSVKDDLNTARAETQILVAKAATAVAQYDDMELRYRQTVESLNSRYDQILDQRNSLTAKLSASQSLPHPIIIGNEEADALRQSLQQLTARVNQSQQHLRIAEAYIEQNMKNWQTTNNLKEQYSKQQAFTVTINADLQNTRKQNIQLGQRIQDFERMVAQTEKLRAENEQLTIIIRQKDSAPVSNSIKQIDETQKALDNYAILHPEAQAREKLLQQQNDRLRAQLAKIGQLEQYLARAQNFILQQQGKMAQTISNFEKENSELKDHLFKAEEYILSMQQAAQKNNEVLLQLQQSRDAQKKRADSLNEGLIRAQSYIFEMENRINKK